MLDTERKYIIRIAIVVAIPSTACAHLQMVRQSRCRSLLALPFLLFSVAADNPSSGQGKVNRNVLYGGGKFAILLIDLHAHNMASCHVDAGVELADIIRMAGEGKTRELEISRASVYRVLAASKGGLIPNRTRPGAGCRDITTGRATSGPVPAGAPRGSQILLPAS
jgi:hypothetical protein